MRLATLDGTGKLPADQLPDEAARAADFGTAAALDVGTTAGTVKAGDWQPAASDVTDATAAGRALLTADDAAAQRSALGLGTAATTPATDYATAAQGAMADTAAMRAAVPGHPEYRQIPVVMMHQFASLNEALGTLKDYVAWGYETIFFSELVDYLRTGDASGLPEKPLCLTDDDGGLSTYTYLYPALQQLGMKCTYFIVPHWVNGNISTPPNGGSFLEASAFTWANAVEMQASGLVEFQSHTLTHGSMRALTGAGTFTADLSADGTGAGADFLAAKAMIEANIPGASVTTNAVPYGVINEAAIASLAAAGCIGNRITATGRGMDAYDGSGPLAFTTANTDPMRVPIASTGNFKDIKRANKWGQADQNGNRFENGKMLASSRGITLPAGWTFAAAQTLPLGASPATGPALRGYGTAAATGAYHTDLIPIGYFQGFAIDFWLKCTLAGATSARLAIDCYDTIGGALVKTLTDPPGASTVDLGNWTRKRWNNFADGTFQWIRPRFEIVGATATSEMLVWDVQVRCSRNPLAEGSPAPF